VKGIWNGDGFRYLQQKFPHTSDAKIEGGIFIGYQIKDFMNEKNFDEVLEGTVKTAWEASSGLSTTYR
jgi:hypothetical protein